MCCERDKLRLRAMRQSGTHYVNGEGGPSNSTDASGVRPTRYTIFRDGPDYWRADESTCQTWFPGHMR